VDAGDRLVRDTVFPVASQAVLRDLVAEFKSSGPTYQRTVKATLKGSYTNHYRTGLIKLLDVLEFRSNNTTHRPVLDALDLIARYASAGNLHYYPAGEHIPVHRGLGGDWDALVYKDDKRRRRRVVRMVYEVCTFQALREQLRCKEIWVVGADKWRNPAEDLPTDFEDRRIEHYQALRKPLDPTEFINQRFMKANAAHPAYQAMIELGRVQKTIFLARFLRSRALQREIHEGLNVVESWNRANAVIFYGKGGDLATNRHDEQEMSVLCLRILQAALVYVNTLMIQDLLADPEWADLLTAEDRRGLTPLFWSHVLPYGEVKLNMASRLTLSTD